MTRCVYTDIEAAAAKLDHGEHNGHSSTPISNRKMRKGRVAAMDPKDTDNTADTDAKDTEAEAQAPAADEAATDGEDFSVPADLSELDDDALAKLQADLVATFRAERAAGTTDVPKMSALADEIERVNGESEARVQAAAEAQAAIDEADARVSAIVDAPSAQAPAEAADDDGDGSAEAVVEDDTADEQMAVAASGGRTSARSFRRHAPQAEAPARPAVTITAAADLPNIVSGSDVTLSDVTTAMHAKALSLSKTSGQKVPVASFSLNNQTTLTAAMSDGEKHQALTAAIETDPALTASGQGWCTPSETIYDLFTLPAPTNRYTVPSIGVDRGGLRWPGFIGFDGMENNVWVWSEYDDMHVAMTVEITVASNVATAVTSEASGLEDGGTVRIETGNNAIDGIVTVTGNLDDATAGTFGFTFETEAPDGAYMGSVLREKSCFRIPCPEWDEARLEALGICITHGNLIDQSFPELSRPYIERAMSALDRRIARRNLAKSLSDAHCDELVIDDVATDTFGRIMNACDLAAEVYRNDLDVADTVVIESVFPAWVKRILRSNLAMRAGVDNMLAVPDSVIMDHFAVRGFRPQFVVDYRPLDRRATSWPTALQFQMAPAGTFFEGNGGQISLGVMRDSTLNKTNDHSLVWAEKFQMFARRGPKALRVDISLDGTTTGVTG